MGELKNNHIINKSVIFIMMFLFEAENRDLITFKK